jgi:hypothetical protein
MAYTYSIALILLLIALYLAEHIYLKDNTKVYNIKMMHILCFSLLLFPPYLNVFLSAITILLVITKNSSHVDYFYNGVFSKVINKIILRYNNFLWLDI